MLILDSYTSTLIFILYFFISTPIMFTNIFNFYRSILNNLNNFCQSFFLYKDFLLCLILFNITKIFHFILILRIFLFFSCFVFIFADYSNFLAISLFESFFDLMADNTEGPSDGNSNLGPEGPGSPGPQGGNTDSPGAGPQGSAPLRGGSAGGDGNPEPNGQNPQNLPGGSNGNNPQEPQEIQNSTDTSSDEEDEGNESDSSFEERLARYRNPGLHRRPLIWLKDALRMSPNDPA